MSTKIKTTTNTPDEKHLPEQLAYLKLTAVLQHYAPMVGVSLPFSTEHSTPRSANIKLDS